MPCRRLNHIQAGAVNPDKFRAGYCTTCMSLMEEQFVVTYRHSDLLKREKIWQILNRPKLKHVMFLRNYKEKHFFCGHDILTYLVFMTQLLSNSGISFWRIAWDAKNFCFMTYMALPKSMWDLRFFRPCWWRSNSFGIWLTYRYQRVLRPSWETGILTYALQINGPTDWK